MLLEAYFMGLDQVRERERDGGFEPKRERVAGKRALSDDGLRSCPPFLYSRGPSNRQDPTRTTRSRPSRPSVFPLPPKNKPQQTQSAVATRPIIETPDQKKTGQKSPDTPDRPIKKTKKRQTTNRLQALNEYIEDTEDLVNLKLDQHRNELIGVDLVLTAMSLCMAMMTAVAGYFGMVRLIKKKVFLVFLFRVPRSETTGNARSLTLSPPSPKKSITTQNQTTEPGLGLPGGALPVQHRHRAHVVRRGAHVPRLPRVCLPPPPDRVLRGGVGRTFAFRASASGRGKTMSFFSVCCGASFLISLDHFCAGGCCCCDLCNFKLTFFFFRRKERNGASAPFWSSSLRRRRRQRQKEKNRTNLPSLSLTRG